MLLRIDDIVSGIKKDRSKQGGGRMDDDAGEAEQETFGDNRDG